MPEIRPLRDFEQEIVAFRERGVRKVRVPDRGFIAGCSLVEASERLKALDRFAKSRGVKLVVYNATAEDLRSNLGVKAAL